MCACRVFGDEGLHSMPVRDFLDTFLPVECDVFLKTALFEGVLDCEGTEDIRAQSDRLAAVISTVMEGYTVKNVSTLVPPSSSNKFPDIVASLKENAPETDNGWPHLLQAELCHHLRDDDLSSDGLEGGESEESEDEDEEEEEEDDNEVCTMDQIYACLISLYSQQHRTHAFHVFITWNIARLLRVDNSGLVISEPLPLEGDSSLLHEFYWRFSHAPADMRGHDLTVRRANQQEAALALENLKDIKDYKFEAPFHVFDVPNPVCSSAEVPIPVSRVVASLPISQIIGRATRACPAYDLDRRKVLFLKDSWRQDDDDHDKESDLLRDLHRKNVQHIPILFAGDDVPGPYQSTLSHKFSSAPWRASDKAKLPAFVHHRILQEFLPNGIMDSKTAYSMLSSIHEGLIAHQQAYENCGILHRDVSVNNIRISNGKGAVLVDWDLAIRIRGANGKDLLALGVRQPRRQGTIQFMSSFLSPNPEKIHDLQDDLESFLWVVLYVSLALFPFKTKLGHTSFQLHDIIFNQYARQGELFSGGYSKSYVLGGSLPCIERLDFPHHKPLLEWWNAARKPFFHLDRHRDFKLNDPDSISEAPFPIQLVDHSYLISITKTALEKSGWSDITSESLPQDRGRSADSSTSPSTSSEEVVAEDAPAGKDSKECTPVALRTRSRDKKKEEIAQEIAAQEVEWRAGPRTRSMARKSATNLKAQTADPQPVIQKQLTTRKSTKNLGGQAAAVGVVNQKQPTARKSTKSLKDAAAASQPKQPAKRKSSKNLRDQAAAPQPKQLATRQSTRNLKDELVNQKGPTTRTSAKKDHIADSPQPAADLPGPVAQTQQPRLRRSDRKLNDHAADPPAQESQPSGSGAKAPSGPPATKASTSKFKAVLRFATKRTAKEEKESTSEDGQSGGKARKRGRR